MRPTSRRPRPPTTGLREDAKKLDAIRGDKPFMLHPDGLGWLFAPTGLVDGPLPAHYEPQESPFTNSLYPQEQEPDPPALPRVPRTSITPAAASRARTCSRSC